MSEIKEDEWNGKGQKGDMEFFDAYMPSEIHVLSEQWSTNLDLDR